MRKIICLCIALTIAGSSLVFAKDMHAESAIDACEYLGLDSKEISKMRVSKRLGTIFVAIVDKMKRIESKASGYFWIKCLTCDMEYKRGQWDEHAETHAR